MRESEGYSAPYRRGSDCTSQGSVTGSRTSLHAAGVGEEDEERTRETADCDSEEPDDLEPRRPPPAQGDAARERKDRLGQQEAPDGGWGWVVLVATIVDLALTLAFPSCIGIFYTDLQTEFNASNSETSWVPSIMTAVLHAGGPLCSVLVEHFGCRPTVMVGGVMSGAGMAASSFARSITELYITAGVVTGLGFCFCFQPAVTIMGHYFVRRRAFANAMSSTGTALGLCFLPLLAHFLLVRLGWRGSFLVLGALLLNCCVCGAVMRPVGGRGRGRGRGTGAGSPQPNGHLSAREKEGLKGGVRAVLDCLFAFLRRHMAFDLFLSNRRYRAFTLGVTWMMLGFVVPLIYLVPYATASGVEPARAALLLAALGFVNVFARPLAGLLLGLPSLRGRRRLYARAFAAALLVNGLSNVVCGVAGSFPALLAYALAFGLSMSVVGSLLFTVLMDTVEMERFPAALGLLTIMESATLLVGPPLAGMLVDSTGQYAYVFYACSASVVSAALFLMGSFYWLDRERHGEEKELPPSLSSPGSPARPPRPALSLSTHCLYSSVPTQGARGLEPTEFVYITSV
ncbi:monocarboxylate transporter 6-like [Megalops cyprinoides]|uniref:monocarboxylate transporter 6-like n=1 Tax=Megalops cyprinoides TaxID=118141 RepID=UPI001863FE1D|nr:monocarboxylate transporter 6-like [Megalops cyprinoides]